MAEAQLFDEFSARLDVRIRTCVRDDLFALEWFGLFSEHRRIIHEAFARQERGDNLMLIADVKGWPAGQVWIDFTKKHRQQAALLWAVRVFPGMQRVGIGARLIAAAERAARMRGFHHVELGVERTNAGPRRLYERLGYRVVGTECEAYEYVTPNGIPTRVPVDQWIMRKRVSPLGAEQDDRKGNAADRPQMDDRRR